MGLKITYTEGEGTLRSIGDPPNGIVNLAEDMRGPSVGWVVDPVWQPREQPDGVELSPVRGAAAEEELRDKLTFLDLDEFVAALQEAGDGQVAWSMMMMAFAERFRIAMRNAHIEPLYLYLDAARELRDLLNERFHEACAPEGGDD